VRDQSALGIGALQNSCQRFGVTDTTSPIRRIAFVYAPEFLAGTVVLPLIVNIRDAWDLMLSLAHRRGQTEIGSSENRWRRGAILGRLRPVFRLALGTDAWSTFRARAHGD